jgi:hypothetical protein
MRRQHPEFGPRTILYWLGREQVGPLPGRSSIYRALVRHRLVEPRKRRRKKEDYIRWERSRSMELWQMDLVGGFYLREPSVFLAASSNSRSRPNRASRASRSTKSRASARPNTASSLSAASSSAERI